MTNWRWTNFAFLMVFHVLSMSTATGNTDNTLLNLHDGKSLDQSVLHSAVPKPQRYDTTVPLLLEGRQRKPLSQLKSRSHPASLKLVVEAEGEQLVLALEKNQGLFASHYTETHYLDDGSAVTGAHNFTKNCYYHGEVEGHANSDVTLSTCSGLRGFISLENKTFILEPSLYQDNNKHIIYRGENLNLSPGTCGHGFNMSSVTPDNHLRSPFRTFSTRVRLVINFSSI